MSPDALTHAAKGILTLGSDPLGNALLTRQRRAYLFDLDGTLASSESLKAESLAFACRTHGGTVDPSVYCDVMGSDWATVTGHFFKVANVTPDPVSFDEDFKTHYIHLLRTQVAATAGACEFIASARQQAIQLGLVSSAMPWMVYEVLKRIGLQGAFQLEITQADVTKHKPDPAAYLLALEKLALHSHEVLVFEDSRAGVDAAIAAGCPCIAIRHAFNRSHDFTKAERVVENFHELIGEAL